MEKLKSSERGLSKLDASHRLSKFGPNMISEKKRISAWEIFTSQFKSFLILIMVAAVIISAFVGEMLDAMVILAIIVMNAVFGFVQEYKAEKSIEALKKMSALKARVVRGRNVIEVDASELVPGDVIVLETGDKITADARLIESIRLEIDESTLTGESVPVQKSLGIFEGENVSNQKNMVFSGTVVVGGRCRAIVVATGMKSEIGKIAGMVQESGEEPTPLQLRLQEFGEQLGVMILVICAIIFAVGVGREYLVTGSVATSSMIELFIAAVSLAVAAIPEGLPAIVTISLALGVQRMVDKNALVRKLPAIETLGSTNIICSDKTGTLTKNEMTVRELYVAGTRIRVSGEGYIPKGKFEHDSERMPKKSLEAVLRIGTLCNDSGFEDISKGEGLIGDPTEAALLVSAAKLGMDRHKLEKRFERIDELPFDSDRKMMTTVHKDKSGKLVAFTKGAPDELLKRCSKVFENGRVSTLTASKKKDILKANDRMAKEALRVLGFAYRPLHKSELKGKIEKNLTFVGLQGMMDPPRPEVREALDRCATAGIRTVMITGDNLITAEAVANELGMLGAGDLVMTGEHLNGLSDEQFDKIVMKVRIYARVMPAQKSRIVETLHKKGLIVAMTGDGVNDAPALKDAEIGVSMGVSGTEVAKEASDMILTDDNFTSIVNAVEEGRAVYRSIRQFVQYLLSCNLAEVLVIFLGILFGWPLPLIAIQILWMNLITDGLPALALSFGSHDPVLMKKKPRDPEESILSLRVLHRVIAVGTLMAVMTLGMFWHYGPGTALARTIAFTTLIMLQLANAMTYRSRHLHYDFHTGKAMVLAVTASFAMQLLVIYTPLAVFFKTVPLAMIDWIRMGGLALILFVVVDLLEDK